MRILKDNSSYFILGLFAVVNVAAGSIDCLSPKNIQEEVICGSPELVQLEKTVETTFLKVLAERPKPQQEALRAEQSLWLRTRESLCQTNGDCATVDILRKILQDRLTELNEPFPKPLLEWKRYQNAALRIAFDIPKGTKVEELEEGNLFLRVTFRTSPVSFRDRYLRFTNANACGTGPTQKIGPWEVVLSKWDDAAMGTQWLVREGCFTYEGKSYDFQLIEERDNGLLLYYSPVFEDEYRLLEKLIESTRLD